MVMTRLNRLWLLAFRISSVSYARFAIQNPCILIRNSLAPSVLSCHSPRLTLFYAGPKAMLDLLDLLDLRQFIAFLWSSSHLINPCM
jgi:hypothetical protein